MKIRVRYFAAARELAGVDEEEVVAESATLSGSALCEHVATRHPRLSGYLSRMRLAVNGDFAPSDVELRDGDEVVLIPPVAGGSGATLADVRDAPLSVDECMRAVLHPGAGGVCTFVGVVRDQADGKTVSRLDYEAYRELAEKEMRRILEGIAGELAGTRLAVTHRVGTLAVGDLAIVVAASAPHRSEAFAACRLAIDRIKDTVPVWKKEWDDQGRALWVNLEER